MRREREKRGEEQGELKIVVTNRICGVQRILDIYTIRALNLKI